MLENGRFRITIQPNDKVRIDMMTYGPVGMISCKHSHWVGTYDDLFHAIHATVMNRWTVTEAFKVHKDGRVEQIEITRDRSYTVICRVPQVGDADFAGS